MSKPDGNPSPLCEGNAIVSLRSLEPVAVSRNCAAASLHFCGQTAAEKRRWTKKQRHHDEPGSGGPGLPMPDFKKYPGRQRRHDGGDYADGGNSTVSV